MDMTTIILIAVIVLSVIILIFFIRAWLFGRHVIKGFENGNTIVDGHKGKGKDLVFQYVINKRRKSYYSNIDYGGKYEHLELKEISVTPNTYENFIQGNIQEVKRRFVEKKDIYISDGGVYLPSYADSTLHKAFKSLPLYYPMSRHTANHNIHVNIQNCARLWKPLKEQADFFVHIKGRLKLPFFIFVHAITYDKEESAEKVLMPMKNRFFNKYSKAEVDLFRAQNGEIKMGWLIIRKKKIKYDTRAFEKIIYGNQSRIIETAEKTEGETQPSGGGNEPETPNEDTTPKD